MGKFSTPFLLSQVGVLGLEISCINLTRFCDLKFSLYFQIQQKENREVIFCNSVGGKLPLAIDL